MDLDLDPGAKFASVVRQRFNCSVSPTVPLSSSVFHLVDSFGRSAIRLNEDSVGLILQSCLGGIAKDFNVFHLSDWMFSFSVSGKKVGFMIHRLKHFSCKSFAIFFRLWGGGGPIGKRIMQFGALSKRRNGRQLTLNQKRAMLMLFVHLPL